MCKGTLTRHNRIPLWIVASTIGVFLAQGLVAQCPPGDIVLASQTDVLAFASSFPDCTALPGSLEVRGSVDDIEPIDGLVSVAGDLDLGSAFELEEIVLPNLLVVGRDLLGNGSNGTLTDFLLGNLEHVGGSIQLELNYSLANLDLSSLQFVGDDLLLISNRLVQAVRLDSLLSVGGDLRLNGNDLISIISLGSLQWIGEDLWIAGSLDLETLEVPALDSIGGSLVFWGANSLEVVNFPALQELDGYLFFHAVHQTTRIEFPELTSVGEVQLSYNLALTEIELPPNVDVAFGVAITSNTQLSNCCGLLGALESAQPDLINLVGNAEGCNSLQEIEFSCLAPPLGIPVGGGALRWVVVLLLAASGLAVSRRLK